MGDGAEGARRRSIGGPSHCTSDLVLKSMSRRLAFVDDRSLMDTINRRGVSAAENSRARPRSRYGLAESGGAARRRSIAGMDTIVGSRDRWRLELRL